MKRYFIPLIVLFGLVISCSDDDLKPLLVTVADASFTISEAAQVGDFIGEVPGASSQGSLKFSIISQNPAGVFTIGEDYGELIVAETSALDVSVNQQIVLEVEINKDDITRTSMVTVTILEACLSQLDPAVGDWTLALTDSFGDGWDGAFMTVDIDGARTDYSVDVDMNTVVINIPEGTGRLFFTYVPGDFEEEHLFTILSPDGIIAFQDGPNPIPGELCFDDFVPEDDEPVDLPTCESTNFAGFSGDWILELADTFEDGWDGAFMTATIDGVATDYEITFGLATESFTINVPDGTQIATFSYTAGDFEEEHSYTLTSPDGSKVLTDGPNPVPGEICNE